jgi:hypothetical protein
MKNLKKLLIALLAVSCAAAFVSCDDKDAPTLKEILERGDTVQLVTPSGLAISGSVLSWNAVENARTYVVRIEGVGFLSGVQDTICRLSGVGGLTPGENYRVAVMATGHIAVVGTDTVNYSDSEWSEEVEYVAVAQLPPPTKLRIYSTILTWDKVEGATNGYEIWFQGVNGLGYSVQSSPHDFADKAWLRTGEAIISVRACATEDFATSEGSNAVTYIKSTPSISGTFNFSEVGHNYNYYSLAEFEQVFSLGAIPTSFTLTGVAEAALYGEILGVYENIFTAKGVTFIANSVDYVETVTRNSARLSINVTLPDNSIATLYFEK